LVFSRPYFLFSISYLCYILLYSVITTIKLYGVFTVFNNSLSSVLDSKNIFYLRVLVDLYLQTHLETAKDLIYFQRIFYFPEDMLPAWTKHPHRRWQVASVHFKTFNLQTVNLISRNDTLRKVKLSNFLLKNYLSPPFRISALLGKYKIQTIN